jgi:hypothetical protein
MSEQLEISFSRPSVFCWECGNRLASELHHVVPRSRGGNKTIPLCGECHGKVHGISRSMILGHLIKEGLKNAKKRGSVLGRRKGKTEESKIIAKHRDVVSLLELGKSVRVIAKITGKGNSTVCRIKKIIKRRKLLG